VRARHQSIAFLPGGRLIKQKRLASLPFHRPHPQTGHRPILRAMETPVQNDKPTAERTMLDGGLRGRWDVQGQMMKVDWWAEIHNPCLADRFTAPYAPLTPQASSLTSTPSTWPVEQNSGGGSPGSRADRPDRTRIDKPSANTARD